MAQPTRHSGICPYIIRSHSITKPRQLNSSTIKTGWVLLDKVQGDYLRAKLHLGEGAKVTRDTSPLFPDNKPGNNGVSFNFFFIYLLLFFLFLIMASQITLIGFSVPLISWIPQIPCPLSLFVFVERHDSKIECRLTGGWQRSKNLIQYCLFFCFFVFLFFTFY